MKMEWLMIPGFILCALIMKFFVNIKYVCWEG